MADPKKRAARKAKRLAKNVAKKKVCKSLADGPGGKILVFVKHQLNGKKQLYKLSLLRLILQKCKKWQIQKRKKTALSF